MAVGLALFVIGGTVPAQNAQTGPPGADLKSLLEKTAEYCRMLEASVLDFFCREDVDETIDYTRERWFSVMSAPGAGGILDSASTPFSRLRLAKNFYEYDYQCLRSGGRLTEKRILLKLNGKPKNEPSLTPKTISIAYRNPFLSPTALFSRDNQNEFDFKIAGTDRINRKTVIVIEAALKEKATRTDSLILSGKAWILPETAEIQRIELVQKRAEKDKIFTEREKNIGGDLRLTTRVEFRTEKNGFLFPCALTIEEGYLVGRSRLFKRSVTRIEFSDFRFFTVDVDIRSTEAIYSWRTNFFTEAAKGVASTIPVVEGGPACGGNRTLVPGVGELEAIPRAKPEKGI